MISYDKHVQRYLSNRRRWRNRRPEWDPSEPYVDYKIAVNWWWRERPRITNIFSDIRLAHLMKKVRT